MLGITDSAVKEFKKLIVDSENKKAGIRVFSSGGGCCGPSFGLDVSEKAEDGDATIEKDGLKIYVELKASDALDGATIDYINDGPGKGFKITGLRQSGCC